MAVLASVLLSIAFAFALYQSWTLFGVRKRKEEPAPSTLLDSAPTKGDSKSATATTQSVEGNDDATNRSSPESVDLSQASKNAKANPDPPTPLVQISPMSHASPADASKLMPPPSRPSKPSQDGPLRTARQQPSTNAALRVPSTGPLPNRGPPTNLSNNLLPSRTPIKPNTSATNARKKVLLEPGHSPLDWAALTRSSNLSGLPRLIRVKPSMLKAANGRKGAPTWSSYRGKVYNIEPYLPFHPGGKGELMRAAGKEAEKLFMEVHPWVNWENMLSACWVGVLVSEDDGQR
ncbi:MAG: hypothetical protein M1828_000270 [Chrysothrix sp. TS-e1954]|nr:MAG: hypothetical protein M1828_000270 [Chrysothrix sp. TS-e1954]